MEGNNIYCVLVESLNWRVREELKISLAGFSAPILKDFSAVIQIPEVEIESMTISKTELMKVQYRLARKTDLSSLATKPVTVTFDPNEKDGKSCLREMSKRFLNHKTSRLIYQNEYMVGFTQDNRVMLVSVLTYTAITRVFLFLKVCYKCLLYMFVRQQFFVKRFSLRKCLRANMCDQYLHVYKCVFRIDVYIFQI